MKNRKELLKSFDKAVELVYEKEMKEIKSQFSKEQLIKFNLLVKIFRKPKALNEFADIYSLACNVLKGDS